MSENKYGLLGKKVIVRTKLAGVHCGVVTVYDPLERTVVLENAYRLWGVYTRDDSGSVSDTAANGLKPKGGHSIGAKLLSVTIMEPDGFEFAEMTDAAYDSVAAWKN